MADTVTEKYRALALVAAASVLDALSSRSAEVPSGLATELKAALDDLCRASLTALRLATRPDLDLAEALERLRADCESLEPESQLAQDLRLVLGLPVRLVLGLPEVARETVHCGQPTGRRP